MGSSEAGTQTDWKVVVESKRTIQTRAIDDARVDGDWSLTGVLGNSASASEIVAAIENGSTTAVAVARHFIQK